MTGRITASLLRRVPAPTRRSIADRLERAVRRLDPDRAYVVQDHTGALLLHVHADGTTEAWRPSDYPSQRHLTFLDDYDPESERLRLLGHKPGGCTSGPLTPPAAGVEDDDDGPGHCDPAKHYDGWSPTR